MLAILSSGGTSKHNWTGDCSFHESAFMAFRTCSTNLISSIREFSNCTSLLHVLCRCWTPSRLCDITYCREIWCPSSINALLYTVCSTRCYRSISSHRDGAERTLWTFYTECCCVSPSRTASALIKNLTSSIFVIPIIVMSVGAFNIVSTCFIFTSLAWGASITISHANISPPPVWANNW